MFHERLHVVEHLDGLPFNVPAPDGLPVDALSDLPRDVHERPPRARVAGDIGAVGLKTLGEWISWCAMGWAPHACGGSASPAPRYFQSRRFIAWNSAVVRTSSSRGRGNGTVTMVSIVP